MTASATNDDAATSVPVVEPLEKYRSKDLRREVYRLKLRVVRKGTEMNDHKTGYIALLRAHWRACGGGDGTSTEPTGKLAWTQVLEPSADVSARTMRPISAALRPVSPPPLPSLLALSRDPTTNAREGQVEQPASATGSTVSRAIVDQGVDPIVSNTSAEQPIREIREYSSDMDLGDTSDDADESQSDPQAVALVPRHTDPPRVVVDDVPVVDAAVPSYSPGAFDGPKGNDLEATIKHTQYWESRLTMSKRKIHELYGELKEADQNEEIALLKAELSYYTQERKRAVRSLLSESTGGI